MRPLFLVGFLFLAANEVHTLPSTEGAEPKILPHDEHVGF